MGTNDPNTAQDFDELVDPEDNHDDVEGAPVPVVVVGDVAVQSFPCTTITTSQEPVGSIMRTRLVNKLAARQSAVLSVAGGDVYIGDETVTIGSGFLIASGGTFSYEASAALYAISPTAAVVYVLSQYRDA